MLPTAGREVRRKRWEKSGINNAIVKGINGLPSLNSFKDIDPVVENGSLMNMITYNEISLDERQYCLEKYDADSEPEYEDDVVVAR